MGSMSIPAVCPQVRPSGSSPHSLVSTGFGLGMPSPVMILPTTVPAPTRKTKAPRTADFIRSLFMIRAPNPSLRLQDHMLSLAWLSGLKMRPVPGSTGCRLIMDRVFQASQGDDRGCAQCSPERSREHCDVTALTRVRSLAAPGAGGAGRATRPHSTGRGRRNLPAIDPPDRACCDAGPRSAPRSCPR